MSKHHQTFFMRLRGRTVWVVADLEITEDLMDIHVQLYTHDIETQPLEWTLTREEFVAVCRQASFEAQCGHPTRVH